MRNKYGSLLVLLVYVLLANCGESVKVLEPGRSDGTGPLTQVEDATWLVNPIWSGGVGKDGILSISNPNVVSAQSAGFLKDEAMVVGVVDNGAARAYPHMIIDYHEIVNDKIVAEPLAVTFCPLTGSAIGWIRKIKGHETTFGVSGNLYNNNLIPYDRFSNSNWSQMLNLGINGQLEGQKIKTYPVIETTWGTWKKMYPDTDVISMSQEATGELDYTIPAYGDYSTDNKEVIFPVQADDLRLPRKERVLGVLAKAGQKVYRIEEMTDEITVFHDRVGGTDMVIVGSKSLNFAIAFERKLSFRTLSFTPVVGELPVVMSDDHGNKWDVSGLAVDGPLQGEKLTHPESYIAYWFAWGAIFLDIEIYGESSGQ